MERIYDTQTGITWTLRWTATSNDFTITDCTNPAFNGTYVGSNPFCDESTPTPRKESFAEWQKRAARLIEQSQQRGT